MGILDRSRSTTISEETQINAPVGVQGDQNLTAVALGGGDVYAVSTDHNAIGAATDLARRSVEAGENLVSEATRLSLETTRGVTELATRSGADLRALAESSQEQSTDVLTRALDFTRGLQTKFQDTIGSTVDALQRIGVEQNKSTDQRLAESTDRALKYALIAFGVLAAGLVAFAAMRK